MNFVFARMFISVVSKSLCCMFLQLDYVGRA